MGNAIPAQSSAMSVADDSMQSDASRRRQVGLVGAMALVVGNMVGSGIYLLPASLAPYGAWSLGGWGVTTVGAVLLALVCARLARRQPRAGGPYAYARAAFGDFTGFLVGWGYWISLISASAAIAVAFAGYVSAFEPVLARVPALGAAAALSAVWLLTLLNARGVRQGTRVQIVMTATKLAPLLVIAVVGLWYFHPALIFSGASANKPLNGLAAVPASAALTLWAFLGLELATVPAQYVRDPRRTIPRATVVGTLFAAGVYILATTAVMGLVPNAVLAHAAAPFAEAARHLWGGGAAYLVAAGGAAACFGTLNGEILIQAQVPRAVACDGLFPRIFLRESRMHAPLAGLVISALLVSSLLALNYARGLVGLFSFVIRIATFSALLPYLVATAADWVLAGSHPRSARTRIVDMLLALGAGTYAIWAIVGLGTDALYWGIVFLLAGVPIFLWLRRRSRRAVRREDRSEGRHALGRVIRRGRGQCLPTRLFSRLRRNCK